MDHLVLDSRYATTRILFTDTPPTELVAPNSLPTTLYLPAGAGRVYQGGLRTQNYYKRSVNGKPLVSIITVVFNGEKHLAEAINSVLCQSYDNIEYIVVDGGSTDGSLAIIKNYENYIDYAVSEPDAGISDAFNKGLQLATGDYCMFVNADDFLIS